MTKAGGVNSLTRANFLTTAKTIKDFTEQDRIALPAVKISVQALALQMAAAIQRHAQEHKYQFRGPISVQLVETGYSAPPASMNAPRPVRTPGGHRLGTVSRESRLGTPRRSGLSGQVADRERGGLAGGESGGRYQSQTYVLIGHAYLDAGAYDRAAAAMHLAQGFGEMKFHVAAEGPELRRMYALAADLHALTAPGSAAAQWQSAAGHPHFAQMRPLSLE